MSSIVLVTGGARSGKSSYALERASGAGKKMFIATAVGVDEEMEERIRKHREQRGESFETIESPRDVAAAIRSLPGDTDIAVIDCLTVWLGNLMYESASGEQEFSEVDAFLECVQDPPCSLVIVTNEVGMSVVPATELGRRFRDVAGRVNQAVARAAGEVVLLVSGIPMVIKRAGGEDGTVVE